MSESLITIEPQPDFPRVDLTDGNASLLELMLQNTEIRTNSHQLAENTVAPYGPAHQALILMARRHLTQENTYGIHAGATTLEAITAIVQPHFREYDTRKTFQHTVSLSLVDELDEALALLESAGERFSKEQPNTRDVVLAVATRYNRTIGKSAILGAALVRQIELAAMK